MDFSLIERRVRESLSDKRYNHCVEVMKRCRELAEIYGVDIKKAELVGLAHDVAKEFKIDEIMKIVNENNVKLDDIEIQNPGLMHAKIGAVICKNEFGFTQDMVEAVENHTTGKPNMDLLSKILFVADATRTR